MQQETLFAFMSRLRYSPNGKRKSPRKGAFLLPGHLELSPVIGAVSQVKIDQGLIGDAFRFSQGLEVVDGAAIDIDGDLLLQPARIGVFPWI